MPPPSRVEVLTPVLAGSGPAAPPPAPPWAIASDEAAANVETSNACLIFMTVLLCKKKRVRDPVHRIRNLPTFFQQGMCRASCDAPNAPAGAARPATRFRKPPA